MIKSIELANWKTHKSTKLTFARGTNILIGRMGAGKSSVMDAISFALFGTFPAIQHRRMSTQDLIKNRPRQERNALVRLDFDVEGINYCVERGLVLKEPAKAKLEREGAYVQSQPERVSEEVEKILKVDYDLFSKAVYSEQNRLDYFLELRASDRKKQIDGLLGLDRFAAAQENVTSLANKIRDMVDENEKTLKGFDVSKLNEQMKNLQEEKSRLMKEAEQAEGEVDRLKQELKGIELQIREMREKLNRRNALGRQVTELRGKTEFLEKEIRKAEKEGIPDKKTIQKELDAITSKLEKEKAGEKRLLKDERELQRRIADAESTISKADREIKERDALAEELRENDGKKLQSQVSDATSMIKEAMKNAEAKKAQRSEHKKWLAELEKHLSRCPVCERELTDEMKSALISGKSEMIRQLEREIDIAEGDVKARQGELDRLNERAAELAVVDKKIKGFGDLEAILKGANKEYEEQRGKLAMVQAERDDTNKQVASFNDMLARLKNAKDLSDRIDGYRSEMADSLSALSGKEAELKGIDVDEDKFDRQQKQFAETGSRASRLEAELAASIRYAKEKQLQMDSIGSEMASIDRLSKDVERKRSAVDNLAKFRNSLEETQAILRGKLVNSINSVMKEIWPELYPYEDYTDIALIATEDDYTLKIKTQVDIGDGWQKVDAVASGGERSIAALAMRVALALVLVPNLKWLILDEPTHNIDQTGLKKFIRVFNETLPKIVDQVFIITHDEALKEVSNAQIYTLEKSNWESNETTTAAF